MTKQIVHPAEGGADEDARIWAELDTSEGISSKGLPTDDAVSSSAAAVTDKATQGAATPAVTTTDTADIWAGAPESLRAAFQTKEQELAETRTNYGRVSGTVSALQRQINDLKAKPATAEGETTTATLLESPALKKALEEYPEVIAPLVETLKAVDERNTSLVKAVNERFSAADQQQQEQVYLANENALERAIPDWRLTLKTPEGQVRPEFKAWLEKQPTYVREGFERNGQRIVDPTEATDLIGRYKASLGAATPNPTPPNHTQAKRAVQLESSASPRGPTGNTKLTGSLDGMSDEQIWKFYDDQEKRKAGSR